ncbi:hypothetical protein XU18_1103 [Perkinsela sp. CCAP 1560/4]|nr:hypothetical protein XU18_1103 [Perkinsela sp. CCAP 1560/4]|eukprot:KNH08390.1 hypothetical protein XU18_1103 [Perkinsela sp. CCAP 1560/4]
MPYRPEREMLKNFHGAAHEIPYKRKLNMVLKGYRVNGTPRDVGEIPRKYVLRFILLHQPVTYNTLWEALKTQKDVPLDSMTHLRLVVKMARHEDWVYMEKDQDANEMCLNIKHDKLNDVQQMVYEHQEAQRLANEQKALEEARVDAIKKEEIDEIQSVHLDNLQRELIEVAEKLKKYDVNYHSSLPYATPEGGYDLFWYKKASSQ